MNKKVYVIVVTYNGIKWIDKCFSSLRNSSIPLHVLAIDNNSNDDTVAALKEKFEEVEVIETDVNLGFGRANNLGFKKAMEEKAEYIFLLNQDAWIENDCIEQLINIAEHHPDFSVLAPFQLSYYGNEKESYFNDYVLNQYSPEYNNSIVAVNNASLYKSSFIHAAGWLLPYNTIVEVGGFDPLFFHYGEDNDYVQRLHFKNKFIGFVPKAVMHHFGTNEGLTQMELNRDFRFNFSVIKLKNLKGSFAGVWLLFYKSCIKEILIALFKLDIKLLKFHSYIFRRVTVNLKKINASRKQQQHKLAYLQ